jgi:hypothetical protein
MARDSDALADRSRDLPIRLLSQFAATSPVIQQAIVRGAEDACQGFAGRQTTMRFTGNGWAAIGNSLSAEGSHAVQAMRCMEQR